MHKIDGVKLDEEIFKLVKAKAEKGVRRGKGEPQKVTLAEVCALMIATGVKRRLAANKWAKAHATPKTKKPAKVKKTKNPKKASAKKSVKKGSKKPAAARKPKATKKDTTPASASKPAEAAAPATSSALD